MTYSGGGDDGQSDEVSAHNPDGTSIALSHPVSIFVMKSRFADGKWSEAATLEERPLEYALSDFAMEAICRHHSGWENNDGGSGEVVLDTSNGTIKIEHNAYFTDSEHSVTQL